jgi:hypothetical protein
LGNYEKKSKKIETSSFFIRRRANSTHFNERHNFDKHDLRKKKKKISESIKKFLNQEKKNRNCSIISFDGHDRFTKIFILAFSKNIYFGVFEKYLFWRFRKIDLESLIEKKK